MSQPTTSSTAASVLALTLNGEAYAVAPGTTLAALLDRLGRHPQTVAIEHNGSIVARAEYGEILLNAGDRIEIVGFVQGG